MFSVLCMWIERDVWESLIYSRARQETFTLWIILLYNCMTWKCCLWSFHSPLHPGMNLSADLFIVLFPSSLHMSYSTPLWFCLPLQTDAIHFLGCTEKHFSTLIKTKCNSFSFTPRMIPCKIFLTKPCNFLLKLLPVLNRSCPTDIDHPLNSPSPSTPWP